MGGVGRGVVPRLGWTHRKGGDVPAECPLKWGWGSFPGRSPCAAERRLRGTPGARTQPRTRGCPGASPTPLVSPQPCGDFWGEKVPGKCPPPPGRGGWIPTPDCFFLAPRPAAGCFACLSRRDGRAVPPSTKTRGGDGRAPCGPPPAARRPARRGSPAGGGFPRLSCGRGAAAFPTPPRPWVRCSPRGGMHPTGARGAGAGRVCRRTPLGYTHA